MRTPRRFLLLGLPAAAAIAVYATTEEAPTHGCVSRRTISTGSHELQIGEGDAVLPPADSLIYGRMPTASTALAVGIRLSHANDMTAGQPIPEHFRRALAPYFPRKTLERVRWTVAGRRLSIGTLWAKLLRGDGAVTLDNLVVFTSGRAATRVGLWAHELTHVRQYEVLGLDAFARCYAAAPAALERQARWNANRIQTERKRGIRRIAIADA